MPQLGELQLHQEKYEVEVEVCSTHEGLVGLFCNAVDATQKIALLSALRAPLGLLGLAAGRVDA